jgi:hypothetical protein
MVVSDSIAIADTLVVEEPKDTTKIGFLEAVRNVRIYKKNMQIVCDSLLYSDLDSLGRLFVHPVIWQDITRQYSADSISVMVKDGGIEKANLMANAFIHIQEDSTHYDQIKGTEMLAYFDSEGELRRFDVLGGASALFYIEENDVLATVNKPESKMLSAVFENGNIQKIYYYDAPKNDGYPVVQLNEEEKLMKGFKWQPERRPADRKAVTKLSLRPSERKRFSKVTQPKYKQTEIYFPGYIGDIKMQIAVRDSLRQIREREQAMAEMTAEVQLADSLAVVDSLGSVKPQIDTMATIVSRDSVAVKDSLSLVSDAAETVLDPKALKEAKKAEREAAKLKKQKERELKWAELDKRDADKLKLKEDKKLEKLRKKKRKALKDAARQAEKDAMAFERYRMKFEKEKQKAEAKAAKNSAKASGKTDK